MANDLVDPPAARFADVVRGEFTLFRKVPLLWGAAAFLVLIPVVYTGIYLWSIWNPTAHLSHLPVGLAILDQGAQFEGANVNLGVRLREKLENEHTFDFVQLADQEQAQAAVRSSRVCFALVVPPDFSRNAVSGTGPGVLNVYLSSGGSYAGLQIARDSSQFIVDSINAEIEKQMWTTVLADVAKSRDAATQLRDGAQNALTGSRQLENGLATAEQGAGSLTEGQKKLANGLDGIDTGRLVSAGKQLHDGMTKLAGGLARHPVLDAAIGAKRKDLTELADGAQQYQDKIVKLAAGIEQAAAGANELAEHTEKLESGLAKLHNGSQDLTQGLDRIHDGLDKFVSAIPAQKQEPANLATPVTYKAIDLAPASALGPSLTPYFMGLSLWIGAFTISFLLPPVTFPLSVAGAPLMTKITGKWTIPSLVAGLAAVVLGLFVNIALKVPVRNLFAYYTLLLIAAFTFNALTFSLVSLLGPAGRLTSLILLIMQISVVGGPYPLALAPPFYQAISPFFPMSHLVFGLRAAMFGSFDGLWQPFVLGMLPWWVVGLGLSLIASRRFHYVRDEAYTVSLTSAQLPR